MEDWVARVVEYLSFADRGVLVLVHGAHDDVLDELISALLPAWPRLAICLDPVELYALPRGSVAVYRPEPAHARALNLGRPRVADLELKLVLWCDDATSETLRNEAPDFFDWISHVVECPGGTAPWILENIRAAARARSNLVWLGPGDLREAMSAAGYPDVPRVALNSTTDHEPPRGAWWELICDDRSASEMTAQGWAIVEGFAWSRDARWVTRTNAAPPHWTRVDGAVRPLPTVLREAAERGATDRSEAVLADAARRMLRFDAPLEIARGVEGTAQGLGFMAQHLTNELILGALWEMRWAHGDRLKVGPELLVASAKESGWIAPMLLAFDALDRDDPPAAIEMAKRALTLFGQGVTKAQIGFGQLALGIAATRLGRHAEATRALDEAVRLLRESFGPESAPTLHAIIERALLPTSPRLEEARAAIERIATMRRPDDPDLTAWHRRLTYLSRRTNTAPAA